MLKFWAFIFRRTGYTHPSLKLAEYDHLLNSIDYIEEKYLEILKEGPEDDGFMMSLDNLISLEIGMFQAQHKIYISGDHIVWGDEPLYKKILIKLRRLFNL